MKLYKFTFNPFSENTYLVAADSGQCLIVDPGMMDESEDAVLFDFISANNLIPTHVLNTHCHLDHILGNASACTRFNIEFSAHKNELVMLDRAPSASMMWGVPYRLSPQPHKFLAEGDRIAIGDNELEVLFTPGHAPGHVVFVSHSEKWVIGGDVLFEGSVGRVDLPGCNAKDLENSILQKLYTLPDEYTVFPGHGEETTIGREKVHNAFIRIGYSAF